MQIETFEYSGRSFSHDDIDLIKTTVSTYPRLAQKELAATICELIGWVQKSGDPKTMQCIRLLRKMDEEGFISLPPVRKSNAWKNRQTRKDLEYDLSWIDDSKVFECDDIMLEVVHPGDGLRRWRTYMDNYHKLKDPWVYGCQLRYMIKSGDGRDLGCLLFTAASWALAQRDALIGWTKEDKNERLQLALNNSRFLILPWVQVRYLASRVLSMAAKRIQKDWLERYCYAPVLLETFVDISQYKGTCYKAANWKYIGETQGRGRNDRYHKAALTRKAIYIYPLQRDYISVLKGDKPCKVVDPDGI